MAKGLNLHAWDSPRLRRRTTAASHMFAFFQLFIAVVVSAASAVHLSLFLFSALSGGIKLCIKISLMMFIQRHQSTLKHTQRQPQNRYPSPFPPLTLLPYSFQQNWKLNVTSSSSCSLTPCPIHSSRQQMRVFWCVSAYTYIYVHT